MAGPTAENNPNAFMGRVTLSAYEPYPLLSGSVVSSVAPASCAVVHWVQPQPIAFKNLVLVNSLAAGVPAATGGASTGSEAFSYGVSAYLYSRQDYTSNITNLSFVTSGSFGFTANMGYSSTSQTLGISWVTDSSGGTSNLSTTSSDGAWSNYINGPRQFSLPMQSTIPAGEYWALFQHSSTTATSNSNVTLVSMSQFLIQGQQGNVVAGLLGQSTTTGTIYGPDWHIGLVNGTPTTSTTMAQTVIVGGVRPIWFALSNA